MSDISIENFTERDKESLCRLARIAAEQVLYPRSRMDKSIDEYSDGYVAFETKRIEDTERYHTYTARLDGEVAGYAIGEILPDDMMLEDANQYFPTNVMEVSMVFVDPKLRRRGIAEKLVTTLIEDARKTATLEILSAYVGDWNEPTLELFRKLGFKGTPDKSRPKKPRTYFSMDVNQ